MQPNMKTGHLRVPHGWWYPEATDTETLAGAFLSSDAVLCSDDDEFLDHEQGIPHFKGFPEGRESHKARGHRSRVGDPAFRVKATLSGDQSPAIRLAGVEAVHLSENRRGWPRKAHPVTQ